MPADIVSFIENFWLELWNGRELDEMLERLDPGYSQRDHRPATASGSTRDEWRQLILGWWELVPDVKAADFQLVATRDDLIAYTIRFSGHDTVTGGQMEVPLVVVNRVRDGRVLTGELFDDRADAFARFPALRALSA